MYIKAEILLRVENEDAEKYVADLNKGDVYEEIDNSLTLNSSDLELYELKVTGILGVDLADD